MTSYSGKTVLVTGASSGIGAEMARQLARRGAHVLLTARSEDPLLAIATEARQQGVEAHVFPHDLGQPGAAQALYDAVTSAGHRPDVLINNAGFGKAGSFERFDVATYESMLTLNVTNLTVLTRLFMPTLLGKPEAGVLNVASTAAFQPVPLFAVYAATKAYVLSFSQALYEEYRGRGLAVTCLCPGSTSTPFHTRAGSAPLERATSEAPEKVARVGLDALLRGDYLEVSGTINKVSAMLGRLSPRPLTLKATHLLFRKMTQLA